MALSLNLGKDSEGTFYLCLSNPDTTEMYPLAQFFSEDHATGFSMYMATQGFETLDLPSPAELEQLLDDESS